jgi:uncharacterized protein (DUF58 family)
VPSAAAAFVPVLRPVVLALDLVLGAAVVLDYVRTPNPARLDVRRRVAARVGIGRELVRTLRVDASHVPAAHGLVLEVDEEFPPSFEVVRRAHPLGDRPASGDPSGGPDRTRIGADAPLLLDRAYVPRLRGVHALGALRLRLRGRLGLVERSARVASRHAAAVEPALLGLRKNLVLAASERWRDLGTRVVRRQGGLREFDALREHVPGDEVRLVDWKAFARRGRPIVR